MCEPCTPDALLEAVRGLRVAEPDLGFKPLLAKLQEQQPDLGAATKEVRVTLTALKAESEAARGRGRRAARCRRGRSAFERGVELRLHRLPPAAVSYGRRAGETSHL